MKISNLPPSGTRDFNSEDLARRAFAIKSITSISSERGFLQIDTPAFENIGTLTEKYGDDGESLIFKILKRGDGAISGDADLALRYDLTVPAMRYYAKNKSDLPKVFKKFQVGPVWRADRPGKDRYREFYQCDFDIYGSPSILADCECLQALISSFEALGLNGYVINLNSRKIISILIDSYGLTLAEGSTLVKEMDKIDKIGSQAFLENIKGLVNDKSYENITEDFLSADFAKIIQEKILKTDAGVAAWTEIETLKNLKTPGGRIVFNPLMVRGLDYYTGPIYEVTSIHCKGSMAAGGRYDNLSKMFLNQSIPACGSSIGLDRIIPLIRYVGYTATSPLVYIGVWDTSFCKSAFVTAERLRSASITVSVNLTDIKIGDQIANAVSQQSRYFIFQGPDEMAESKYILKDLIGRTQIKLSFEELLLQIKKG